jgi:hypothetical protein
MATGPGMGAGVRRARRNHRHAPYLTPLLGSQEPCCFRI